MQSARDGNFDACTFMGDKGAFTNYVDKFLSYF